VVTGTRRLLTRPSGLKRALGGKVGVVGIRGVNLYPWRSRVLKGESRKTLYFESRFINIRDIVFSFLTFLPRAGGRGAAAVDRG